MSASEPTSQVGKLGSLKIKFWSKIKKVFEKSKKRSLSEAIKQFDCSKEPISKEVEESKGELQPKVVEIYKSSEDKTKILLKDPTASAVEAEPALIQSLLLELKTAGFPGASSLSDALAKFGTTALAGPITFLLSKASGFVQDEPLPAIPEAEKVIDLKAEKEIETKAETVAATDQTAEEGAPPAPIAAAAGEASIGDESLKETAGTTSVADESAKEVVTADEADVEVEKLVEKLEVKPQPQT